MAWLIDVYQQSGNTRPHPKVCDDCGVPAAIAILPSEGRHTRGRSATPQREPHTSSAHRMAALEAACWICPPRADGLQFPGVAAGAGQGRTEQEESTSVVAPAGPLGVGGTVG